MSNRTLLKLAAGNSVRATGRLVVLALLFAAAVDARSLAYLVQAKLAREAADAVTARTLPAGYNVVVYWPALSFTPEMLHEHVTRGLKFAPWQESPDYLAGWCEPYTGPTGYLRVVRPHPDRRNPNPASQWFSRINGRYPRTAGEVAIPETLASVTGLGPGDTLALLKDGTLGRTVFTITGVYTPLGQGPFYESLLSVLPPAEPVELNWMVARLSEGAIELISTWGTGGGVSSRPGAQPGRTVVTKSGTPTGGRLGQPGRTLIVGVGSPGEAARVDVYDNPKSRMAELARTVYSSGSRAAGLGYGLVGVAVLIILLVAMVERRREAATYKIVGMNSVATLTVLGAELALAFAVALVVAAPAYWFLATRYVLDVHASSPGVLVPPFVVSSLWMVFITAVGSGYPFVLASVGTPNQLLLNQRIYLFRHRQVLRGWAEVDSE